MPSRRQRKAKAAADAVGHTQAGMVSDEPPHPSPIQAAVSGFYQDNYERHVAAAAAAANGVPQTVTYRAAMISEVTKAYVVESQIEGHLVTDLDQMIGTLIPRMIAAFDECWDGQVPASNDDMVMALHVTGGETIDRRGGKSTGGISQEANHPGVRPMVLPKPRSEGTGVKTLEQKWAQSAGTLDLDLGGRPRLPKPRNTDHIDESLWSGAMETARGQVKQEYFIPGGLDAYYSKMCKPGQLLLAGELHRRAQVVYDYRAVKAIYRYNRKQKK